MNDFQLILAPLGDLQPPDDQPRDRFAVEQMTGRTGKVVESIDALGDVWDDVIARLATLAADAKNTVANSPFQIDTIESNVGIEAGLAVGLVTKGTASVAVTFKHKEA